MKRLLMMFGTLMLTLLIATGCSTEEADESIDTENLSVYKTIEFSSYTGDSESKEFDELIGKKITFTNVPTLGGTLGNMVKGYSCRNDSELTIEDDVTYTVTGVVTSTIGTYMVSMKDCTITKE